MTDSITSVVGAELGVRGMRGDTSKQYPSYVDRWALLVGISEYQDHRLKLDYAARDAEELSKLLQQPSSGAFNHVELLPNKKATTANIIRALRTWLKQPKPEDIVLIYFSCHGAPDPVPGARKVVYLLTHDTDVNDISATALRMSEIQQSLQDYLRAERVVVVVDACHSGAVGAGLKGGDEGAAEIQTYLEAVSRSSPGIALLTSAAANEAAREGKQWGDGHGALTHFLLEGMRGEADGFGQPKDGKVTAGELFDYVQRKVKEATNGQQNPAIGVDEFARNFPMSITGGFLAADRIALGEGLYQLGWRVNDKGCFASAVRQFEEAIAFSRATGKVRVDAVVGVAKAHLAAGHAEQAKQTLQRFADRGRLKLPPEADLYLGVAHAHLREYSASVNAFERFLTRAGNHPDAAWARAFSQLLQQPVYGRRFALLIGIDHYQDSTLPILQGCSHDVYRMHQVLTTRFGFTDENIIRLVDKAAKREHVLAALKQINERAVGAETVLIHYSGLGIYLTGLAVYDTTGFRDNDLQNSVSLHELHEAIKALNCDHKVLILDARVNHEFLDLASQSGEYDVLLATQPGKDPGVIGGGVESGAFTFSLCELLSETQNSTLTYSEVVEKTTQRLNELAGKYGEIDSNIAKTLNEQKPVFAGDPTHQVFIGHSIFDDLFSWIEQQTFPHYTYAALARAYERFCQQVTGSIPQAYASFGRAFQEYIDYASATEAFQSAQAQGLQADAGVLLGLAASQTGAGHYRETVATLQTYLKLYPAHQRILQPGLATLDALDHNRGVALLVGVNEYVAPNISPLEGAINDVAALERALVDRFRFRVRVLRNKEATRQHIVAEFIQLAQESHYLPALFYFAGYGSVDEQDNPTIVSADGRQPEIYDLPLDELASLIPGAESNLISIIDAGWAATNTFPDRDASTRQRFLPTEDPHQTKLRNLRIPPVEREANKYPTTIGRTMILNKSIAWTRSRMAIEEEAAGVVSGTLTRELVKVLQEPDAPQLSYFKLKSRLETAPVFLGRDLDALLFDRSPNHNTIWQAIARVQHERIRKTADDLERLVQGRHDPEGYTNLGIAYGYMGDYDKAINRLKHAVLQQQDAEETLYHAHYHLGRILLKSRQELGRAVEELQTSVKELQAATQSNQQNTGQWTEQLARAQFYLGKALQVQAEQDILTAAENAYRAYLDAGAPLGRKEEVRVFLEHRQAEKGERASR